VRSFSHHLTYLIPPAAQLNLTHTNVSKMNNSVTLDKLPLNLLLDITHDLDTMDLLNLTWTNKNLRNQLATSPDSTGVWAYRLLKRMGVKPTPCSVSKTAHQMVIENAQSHRCVECHEIDGDARMSKLYNKRVCHKCAPKLKKRVFVKDEDED